MNDTYPSEIIEHIREYLNYLREDHGLMVTYHLVEFMFPESIAAYSASQNLDTIYREHTHPLCSYFKSKLSFWNHCQERQSKIVERAQQGSFCGMCWAGMTEFIYPVRNANNKIASFICVSGYCVDREKALPRIRRVCEEYNFSFDHAMDIFDNAAFKELPDKRRLDTLMNPLSDMFTLLGSYLASTREPESNVAISIDIGLYTSIRQYIETVYASSITMDDLCRRYSCSASYISRLLRKYGKTSFRRMVNTLRIDLACSMLARPDYSIQYIAMATGFSDANYFSTVFSKYKGVSPREYRKQMAAKNS